MTKYEGEKRPPLPRAIRYREWQNDVHYARQERSWRKPGLKDEYEIGGPALDFVLDYQADLCRKIRYATPGEQKNFRSTQQAQGRAQVLLRYLFDHPELKEKDTTYAKSLLGEIFVRDVFNGHILSKTPLVALSAPAAIDKTVKNPGGRKNKGGDVIIAQPVDEEMVPLLLLDVTAGNNFSNKTGDNLILGAHVEPFSLGSMQFPVGTSTLGFEEYLDKVLKPTIALGEYAPLVDVRLEEQTAMTAKMRREIAEAARFASRRFKYQGDAISQIDAMITRRLEVLAQHLQDPGEHIIFQTS